jgi:uncharacterized protein (TIGR03067 family)
MKKLVASIVCLAMISMVTAIAGGEKAPKIEGTWILTAVVSGKGKAPEDLLAKIMPTAVFKDGKYSFSVMGKIDEAGTYKIDAAKKPASIDLVIDEGKHKGKTQLCIYKIEGEMLTLAVNMPGSTTRPKNFEPGEDVEVQTFKQKK